MAGRAVLLTTALALVAATAAPVAAHQTHPTIYARIDRVEPPLDDVVVEVRAGIADQLLVLNATATPVEVLGRDGRPFLRIAKDGVEADVASADWRASLTPFPRPPAPVATPRWVRVSDGGAWAWFDHRLHESDRDLTPELRRSRTTVRLADWAVPLRQGGTAHTVRGHVEYRPVTGQFRSRVTAAPDGARVDVLDGRVPGVFLRWRGSGTLVVTGIDGAPFARLSRAGAEVNERSATWRDDRALRGQAVEPVEPLDPAPGDGPRWTKVAAEPSLTWLDRRLAYTPGVPPDAVLRRTEPTTMVEWDLPAEVAGKPATISGETTWHPTGDARGGAGRTAAVAGTAAVAAAAGVIAFTLRARGRRRRHVER
ncbi:MAG TPA: hypothetical protein VF519_05550 [Mycobacteriales bacterium]